ncbi:MAG: hypothetical protein JXR27_12170 [Paludibacteraceae bacterium]|nr:hypothetical protein [Paludibacteraceae bacterium]
MSKNSHNEIMIIGNFRLIKNQCCPLKKRLINLILPSEQSFTLREQTIPPFEPMTPPSEPALTPEAQNHPSRKQKTMY